MSPGDKNGHTRFRLVTDAVADGAPVDFDREVEQAAGRELRLIETLGVIAKIHDFHTSEAGGDADAGAPSDAAAPADEPLPSGTVLDDRYEIVSLLGSGSMGEVYRARDGRLAGREVALKRVRPEKLTDDPKARRKLADEIRALAALHDDHVVRITDASAIDHPQPYFVTDLVDGIPLDRYLLTHTTDRDGRLAIFLDVCRGVSALHAAGLLHRDIKPANVVVRPGPEPRAVVVDLGLAVDLRNLKTDSPAAGTPAFMSPDQLLLAPEDLDTRSDVYGLGVLLYQLLTDELPYSLRGEDRDTLRREILDARIVPPRDRVADLPRDLESIVMRALARERTARYASVAELVTDVERLRAGQPVQAHLDSEGKSGGAQALAYRADRLVKRRRAAVIGAIVGVVVAIGGGFLLVDALQKQADLQASRSEFMARERAVLGYLADGRLDEAEAAITDALGRYPTGSPEHELMDLFFRRLVLTEVLSQRPAEGPVVGGPVETVASPPSRTRAIPARWRTDGSRDELTQVIATVEQSMGHAVTATADGGVSPESALEMAGLLASLDQHDRAAEMLLTIPPDARNDWHYRYTLAVLDLRRGDFEGDSDRFRRGRDALRELRVEAEARPELRQELPQLLYNLATIEARTGRADTARSLLVEARDHPAATDAFRAWIDQRLE